MINAVAITKDIILQGSIFLIIVDHNLPHKIKAYRLDNGLK